MATKGFRRDTGNIIGGHLAVRTGVTITAGMPVIADISGTDIVSPMTALGETTAWIGMLTETRTGPSTGITTRIEGVFEFTAADSTVEGFTGPIVTVGRKVWFVSGTLVRPESTTAATLTGIPPIGVVMQLPNGTHATATTRTAWVKIAPFGDMKGLDE